MSNERKDITQRRGDAEEERNKRKSVFLCASAPLREEFLRKRIVFLYFLFFLFSCTNPFMERLFQSDKETDTPLIPRIVTYTVSFDSKGGSPVDSQQVAEGEKATRPNNPTKSGFGFVNWYDNEEYIEPHYNFDTPVTADITLYAQWSDTFYTVTFNSNGGIPAPEPQDIGEGGTVSKPSPEPTREGYEFVGWYSDSDLTEPYDFDTPVTDHLILYAKWVPVYTVTFNSNGGSPVESQTVHEGETATRPNNPTRSGFGFVNWYDNADCTEPHYNFDNPVSADITLYAKWSETFYTVSFDSKGGNPIPAPQDVGENGTASEPIPEPTREGHIFDGWYSDEDCTEPYDFDTPVTDHLFLFAKWIAINTVTFNANGDGVNGLPAPYTDVREGATISKPNPDPSRAGYTFVGWYKDAEGNNAWDFNTDTVTTDTTLYAKWDRNLGTADMSITVEQMTDLSFDDIDGGTISRTGNNYPTSIKFEYIDADTGSYTCKWTIDGVGVYAGLIPLSSTASCTVYATDSPYNTLGNHAVYLDVVKDGVPYKKTIWVEIVEDNTFYTVTFDTNGGIPTPEPQDIIEGGRASRPTQDPAKEDFAFGGWYGDSALTEPYDFDAPVIRNIDLYARWLPFYTVSFDTDGGSTVASQQVAEGTRATRPGNPTKAAFGFVDWYDNAGLTEPHYDFNTPVTGDITLYAKWSNIFHTVSFNSNDGSPVTSQLVVEGGTASRPTQDPTKGGYAFGGWYGDSALTALYDFDTPVTGTVTLYARWLAFFTVTFNTDGGSPTPVPQDIIEGGKASRPQNPTKADFSFENWYSDSSLTALYNFNTPVTGNITLYAKWITYNEADFGAGATITTINVANATEWDTARNTTIRNGGTNKNYIINVIADFEISATGVSTTPTFGTAATTGIKVSLRGAGRTLTLRSTATGRIIIIQADQTVIWRDLALKGHSGNAYSAVHMLSGGTFIMHDGEIFGNTANSSNGGGVYVSSSTFTMYGGTISGNTSGGNGGGVRMAGGTFTMYGGKITGNTGGGGGGVYVSSGTFTMYGGEISGNTATGSGGGVYVPSDGTFTMHGGTISGNTSTGSGTNQGGGGVNANGTNTIFRIVTGTIYGSGEAVGIRNTASSGAALFKGTNGTAERGTFSGDTWVPDGTLATTNDTIRVVEGELQ